VCSSDLYIEAALVDTSVRVIAEVK